MYTFVDIDVIIYDSLTIFQFAKRIICVLLFDMHRQKMDVLYVILKNVYIFLSWLCMMIEFYICKYEYFVLCNYL